MSTKKRKGELPESTSTELLGKSASQNVTPPQPESSIDDGESDWKRERAAMQAQLDEFQAENERLRAAALAPCPRCDFHPNWTVRVRTMNGQVHTVLCPDGPKTSMLRVKQGLAKFDPKYHILQQLTLVLPCDESSSSSSSSSSISSDDVVSIDSALADDQTLASCGVSREGLLELLLVDMVWDDASLAVIEGIKNTGVEYFFNQGEELDEGIIAVSWSLVNAVCYS